LRGNGRDLIQNGLARSNSLTYGEVANLERLKEDLERAEMKIFVNMRRIDDGKSRLQFGERTTAKFLQGKKHDGYPHLLFDSERNALKTNEVDLRRGIRKWGDICFIEGCDQDHIWIELVVKRDEGNIPVKKITVTRCQNLDAEKISKRFVSDVERLERWARRNVKRITNAFSVQLHKEEILGRTRR